MPPNASTAPITRATASLTISLASSGPRRSASAVEPIRSANIAVTTRRSSRICPAHEGILPDGARSVRGCRPFSGSGERDERLGLGPDRVGVEEAFEPGGRQPPHTVAGAEQGAGHRRVGVGVAAERDDAPQLGLDVAGAHERLERRAGGEQAEALIGSVDRPRAADRLDEELELLAALEVLDGAEGGAGGVVGGLAPDERGDAERDRGDRGAAAAVDMREGREGGRELEEPLGAVRVGQAEGRAVHDRAVAGRDLGPALVPDRLGRGRGVLARRDAAEDASREGADVRGVGAEPRQVAFEHVGGVQAAPGGERAHQVPGHRGVVGGRARRLPEPGPLERRDRVRDVAGPQELEGGSERVPEREPEGAAHDAIGEVHPGRRAYRGGEGSPTRW